MTDTQPMTQDQLVDLIIRFEQDEAPANEVLDLFAELVRTGAAWTLQGHYGRTASGLIAEGWISPEGEVLRRFDEED